MRNQRLYFFLLIIAMVSCKENFKPKPKALLSLQYPTPKYQTLNNNCPYSFEVNEMAHVVPSRNKIPCWINLEYELLQGSIYLTYQPVKNNLDSLLTDAQNLPLKHTIKADAIEGDIYTNEYHKTYGMFYEVSGNAASQAQFYLTDSTKHFITGSVYFNTRPNYDSIIPAAAYLKNDIKHLMESLEWNN